jgi:hypothetical protein
LQSELEFMPVHSLGKFGFLLATYNNINNPKLKITILWRCLFSRFLSVVIRFLPCAALLANLVFVGSVRQATLWLHRHLGLLMWPLGAVLQPDLW